MYSKLCYLFVLLEATCTPARCSTLNAEPSPDKGATKALSMLQISSKAGFGHVLQDHVESGAALPGWKAEAGSMLEGATSAGWSKVVMADRVKDAIKHLWQGYKTHAWGSDEVRPLTGVKGDRWGDVSMFMLDTMDTLWLADMKDEFAEGEAYLASSKWRLDGPKNGYRTSFFEMTIRGLGGLLSCYALTGHKTFLDKSKELGSRLVTAFPEKGEGKNKDGLVWPAAFMDIRKPSDFERAAGWLGKSILADVGSNVLEFSYLSQISQDQHYKTAADENENNLLDLSEKSHRHLVPKFLNSYTRRYAGADVSVGAYADSYFEYLLKGYIQSGRTEHKLLAEWKGAMTEMRSTLVRKSKGGYTFIAMQPRGQTMEHLACFMGGLLALGSHVVPKEEKEDWWLPVGTEITRTCYEMYHQSPSGLSGESSAIGKKVQAQEVGYRARPETLESLFYLYRITGNETYRQWSSEIFNSIDKHLRTPYGFASAYDVTKLPVKLADSEETFVGAETLKYALLVHLPESVLPLDKFVLNTEAHPLRVVHHVANN